LFSCFGIVSVFMTDTQMGMYRERSAAEYQRIALSLSRDIAVLYGISQNMAEDINNLLRSYMGHYAEFEIILILTPHEDAGGTETTVSFVNFGNEHFIQVSGQLPEPFGFLRLDYFFDITEAVTRMRYIQNLLLIICIAFALLTAFILYFILARIFKPLSLVSRASRKIATGNYRERIPVHGKNELAAMAEDFNSMAAEIERQVKELKNEAEGKQQFIDDFAHEMRTPLTSILGYAEYIQKAAPTEEETLESAQYIIDGATLMKNMANSLLTLATLRGYTAVKNELSIPQLFIEVKQSLEKMLDAGNVRLALKCETETLCGQEDLLVSLLLNLCANALKACPADGSGFITLSARGKTGTVVISVIDNGRGIPKESLAKITEPFYRVDKTRNRGDGGAGLGLALCRRIAEAHNAALTIDSTPDVGTKVEITFTTP
jgi:signal transduction histidine kinase